MTVPNEKLQQYTDRQGINYVACYPSDDLEPWFQEMIERYGLEMLVQMYPYQTLVLDPKTGFLRTYYPCRYNAKITNAFHLQLAKLRNSNQVTFKDADQEWYSLRLAEAFPDHDDPEVRDVSPPTSSSFVATEEDGYGLNLGNLPESIPLKAVSGWHPNRDANGNYMSAQQYNVGPYNPYWSPYTPYPGGYNYYPNNTYLPQYRTLPPDHLLPF